MYYSYPPFFDDHPFGIYEKILSGKITFPSHFDSAAKDLIRKLLTADRTRRLGNLKNGVEDIKRHKWFKGVNWENLTDRSQMAPIVPEVRHEGDTQNFEVYPEPIDEDGNSNPSTWEYTDLFKDF